MSKGNVPRVGFVGLGIMGAPMSANVLKAGFPLTVWNRTPARCEPLRKLGAAVAGSAAEVAATSDLVLTCVTASADVLGVVLGPAGIIEGVRPGSVVVDHSTVDPGVAVRCAEALGAKGAGFLDAPVSGGQGGAQSGTLSIMVGGPAEHFNRALPVLEAMGKTVTLCGPHGAGYVVKLCNQVLVSMHCQAAAEALSLAQAAGIDPKAMLRAVSSGAAGSWQLSNLAPKMLAGDYAPGFMVDYLLKDLRMAQETASRHKVPLPGLAVAEAMFRAASAHGHGRDGTQAVYEAIRRLRAPR